MCLDILVVWWFEILKAQSIQSHRELFKDIKHVTHGSPQHLIRSYEKTQDYSGNTYGRASCLMK